MSMSNGKEEEQNEYYYYGAFSDQEKRNELARKGWIITLVGLGVGIPMMILGVYVSGEGGGEWLLCSSGIGTTIVEAIGVRTLFKS